MTIESPDFQPPAPFAAPLSATSATPQTNWIHSRISHYINNICNELDRYERDKTPVASHLLKFYDNTPLLEMRVARNFASLTTRMITQFSNLESLDSFKFGRVIKLLENTVNVSAELDIIEDYTQNKNKTTVFFKIHLINDAIEMCSILFEMLESCKLDRQFISRNLTNCLHFIKNQLDHIVYPFIDLTEFEDEPSSLNLNTREVYALIESSIEEKKLASTFVPNINRFLRRAFHLIEHEGLDDNVLVTVAYISMAPFFHDYSEKNVCILLENASTFSPYEQLKLSTLQMLKHIFGVYPQHRRWIFEEILTSLGSLTVMSDKKNYRLRDNQSIHIISALFMELVQASSAPDNMAAHKNWFRSWSIKYQKAQKNNETEKVKLLNDKLLTKSANAWRLGAEATANSASFFLEFLMSKCKTKSKDVYSLKEYRQLLVNTLEDVMAVFNDPEWPVSELIMKVFSRILISLLEGDHSDAYLKTLAVEWLGIIACKIKTSQIALSGEVNAYTPEWVYELNERLPIRIDLDTPIESIELWSQCRKKLMDSVIEGRASANVIQFYLCNWGFTESVVWTRANEGWRVKEKPKEETMTPEEKWPIEVVNMLQDNCKFYWQSCLGIESSLPKPSKVYVFPEMYRTDIVYLTELLASRQTLYKSYDFILSEILTCLNKDATYLRLRSLKSIGKILSQVPEILEQDRLRTSVVKRVHDIAPRVRDAALEVVAKYLSQQHDISLELYELVGGRILDTDVAVRKRSIKLLLELYFKFTDVEVKKDIAAKLIMRIGDNEATISQLSLKATQEILFLPFKEIEKDGNDHFGYSYANASKERKQNISKLTDIITGAVAKLDSSLSTQKLALSQIVQKTIDGAVGDSKQWYEKIFQWIVDSLFDRMIILDEESNTTEFVNCLATVHSFAKSCPDILRKTQISMLQPYLAISEQDDWTITSYILGIYRDVLPRMKRHDRDSIELLERMLLQILTKCPLDIVAINASCICVIVSQISHRYNILIKILGSCVTKLHQTREAILHGTVSEKTFPGVLKMILLCGMLCQDFEFDKRREEEPTAMAALDLVYKGNVGNLVYGLLRFFTGEDVERLGEQGVTLQMTALQGLGYFYSAYPIYVISEASTQLMDKIFREGTHSLKAQLVRVLQQFLGAEEKRIGKREEEAEKEEEGKMIGIDTLLGNTEEYAELGVNGSLMQRYLPKVLECALSELAELRYAAFEIVSSVVHRGLAHPVLCMSVIVAAETSPDAALRTKAYYIHKYAHDKYGTLLYIQMNDYINMSYQYQTLLLGSKVKGYGRRGGDSKVESVLGLGYSILREHEKSRFDFFRALVRPFTFELKTTSHEDIDTTYLRYLAENIMMLDFATTNEVLFVIYHMDRLLISLGTDLLSFVQFLKNQGKLVEFGDEVDLEYDVILASKLSIALCIILLLKKLLVEQYDIPDDEIHEYHPSKKRRSRDAVKDVEMTQTIEWEEELLFFQHNRLENSAAIDACSKFEYLFNESEF